MFRKLIGKPKNSKQWMYVYPNYQEDLKKKKLLSLKNIETEIDDGTVSGLIDRLHIDETEFVRQKKELSEGLLRMQETTRYIETTKYKIYQFNRFGRQTESFVRNSKQKKMVENFPKLMKDMNSLRQN